MENTHYLRVGYLSLKVLEGQSPTKRSGVGTHSTGGSSPTLLASSCLRHTHPHAWDSSKSSQTPRLGHQGLGQWATHG